MIPKDPQAKQLNLILWALVDSGGNKCHA
jgi:hypothetical protein